jgi:hypothetical protein
MVKRKFSAYPLNVEGDFYVQDGCCLSCQVPFTEAKGHFAWDDEVGHCYVCKQPSTDKEVKKMINAVNVSEVSCIRYAGDDPKVLKRLRALGESDQCDVIESNSIKRFLNRIFGP